MFFKRSLLLLFLFALLLVTFVSAACIETWTCTDFVFGNDTTGLEYRSCTDSSGCNSTFFQPVEVRPTTPVEDNIWFFIILASGGLLIVALALYFESAALGVASAAMFFIVAGSLMTTQFLPIPGLMNGALAIVFMLVGIYVPFKIIGEA